MALPDAATARRAQILDAATGVFLRFGFRKTSMDDLARAAGLSRQGLYLQFPTKEALFKDAVRNVIATTRAAAQAALARTDAGVEDRLLNAFDALHGHAIGTPGAEHLPELLETATQLVGPVFEDLEQTFVADVARILRATGVADKWKAAGVSAKDLAVHLYTASNGAKHRPGTHADYRDHMRTAIRIVCRAGESGS
ncbi:MAG TPA: TetR/AcrR family transcriptional regulator [Vicinamibacterales bacterium]|nr:TetR/AcrR family transcriptional regulator [Vicinamibacterales bacterium]